MELYSSITLKYFVEIFKESVDSNNYNLKADNLLHILPEEDYMYGLSLLRKAIACYEEEEHIPVEKSKKNIPFFRENSRVLVGPEMGLFTVPFYEKPLSSKQSDPILSLSWDYEKLAEYCLFENLFLVRCKYDANQIIETFKKQLKQEYDKFFYDEEHTGFMPDSRFFSMLCNACLEVRKSEKAEEKEWCLLSLKPYGDATYRMENEIFTPFVPFSLPKDCLKEVTLVNASDNPLLYGTLAVFLTSIGLSPEIYLKGMQY